MLELLSDMSVKDLKEIASTMGLTKQGTKAVLIAKISKQRDEEQIMKVFFFFFFLLALWWRSYEQK